MTILELEKIEKGLSALEAELEASKDIVNNEIYIDFINNLRKQIDDKMSEIYLYKQQTEIDFKL